jgi:hypothetical protein
MGRSEEAAASVVEPALVVRDLDDQWTPAFRRVRAAMGMPTAPD